MFEVVKKNWFFIFYLAISLFSINPLLSPGFFPMHDDTQVARVFEMAKSLSHGMFPVRWVEDLGYGFGYPIFNFYSVLPYYIGGLLTNIGFDALSSTKIIFSLALIGSGASMFFLIKEFFGKAAGLVTALVYLYFPYHAVNIYVRGDLAEVTAYAFLPLVFLSLLKVHQSSMISKRYIVLGSLSISAVVLSHNLSFFMLSIFLSFFILISLILKKSKKKLLIYGLILGLAFLLSAFYSVPAILEMKHTNISSIIGGGSDYRDHFVCIKQLWDSPWGFGGSAPTCVDGMSFKLGKLNILLFVLAFILFVINWKKLKDNLFIVSFAIAGFLVSIFMILAYSSIVWSLPFMDFLQFPWRFLNFAGLFMSVVVGYLVWQVTKYAGDKILIFACSVIILLTLIYNGPLFNPKTIDDRNSNFYTSESQLKWVVSKISDEYLSRNFTRPKSEDALKRSQFDIVKGKGDIEVLLNRTGENKAKINLFEDGIIRANIAFFPAWKAYVDGRESSYIIKDDGLYISLPKGQHTLTTKFVQTPIEKVSNLLSLIGLLGMVIVIIPYGKKTS